MEMKIPAIAITAVVVVIVLAGVLMPVLDDTTAKEDTFTNKGYFHLQKYTAEDTYSISWNLADPTAFTINGESFTYLNDSGMGLSVVLGESFYLRLNDNNARMSFNNNGTYVNTSDTYQTMSLTYSGGTVTATNGNASRSVSDVSEIYAISETGSYVMKKSDAVAYLNSGSEIIADSEIFASGQSSSGSNNLFWHMEGTIDNIEYPDSFNSNLTVTDEVINGKYNNSHDDLYELTNLQFVVTTNASVVYNITASYFVVPAEVTADRADPMPDNQSAIFMVIPIMVIVALLVAVVALVFRGRDF